MSANVELVLARHTVQRAVVVGPIVIGAVWAIGGNDAALASAIGVVIVVGYFMLTGVMLSLASRISLGAYHAAALFGFIFRLGFIAATMFAVAAVFEVDRTALGITVVVTFLALLTWETIAVATGKEREIEWAS